MNDFNKAIAVINQRKMAAEEKCNNLIKEIENSIPDYRRISKEINFKIDAFKYASLSKNGSSADSLKKEVDDLISQRDRLLKQHGYNYEELKPVYFCRMCNDTGYVNGKLCDCVIIEQKRQEQKRLISKYPVPEYNFNNFNLGYYSKEYINEKKISPYSQMKNILARCIEFVKEFNGVGNGLLFIGSSGLGKTHLACSIANEVLKKGYTVLYISAQKLFDIMEQGKYGNENNLKDFMDCDLLVVDDLGMENYSTYSMSTLYSIFNTRMVLDKPCIFTTNMKSRRDIENRYGEKISSRMIGTTKLLYCLGTDIRIVKGLK